MKFNLGEFYKNLSTISHLVKTEQEKNLHPGKGPSKPIRNEAGWACGPVWYGGKGTRDLKKAIYVHLVLSWERLEIYLLSFLCFLRVHRDFFTFRVDPKLRNTVSNYVVHKYVSKWQNFRNVVVEEKEKCVTSNQPVPSSLTVFEMGEIK
jgi:hypothetical protein